ncbi:hypothetical protein Acr_11g0003550 [Actinidia rufa]|uniref:NAC domain-containing protein n=1 Tax=Actinidia rufa TaxID=165716 RepID=A0A7J0FCS9_9ERIC|nr:hypothetical protein Acr_11g0003550 [Actinidia rufa]
MLEWETKPTGLVKPSDEQLECETEPVQPSDSCLSSKVTGSSTVEIPTPSSDVGSFGVEVPVELGGTSMPGRTFYFCNTEDYRLPVEDFIFICSSIPFFSLKTLLSLVQAAPQIFSRTSSYQMVVPVPSRIQAAHQMALPVPSVPSPIQASHQMVLSIPYGFKFSPEDHELIYILYRKVNRNSLPVDEGLIEECDLFGKVPKRNRGRFLVEGEKTRYFFVKLKKKGKSVDGSNKGWQRYVERPRWTDPY